MQHLAISRVLAAAFTLKMVVKILMVPPTREKGN
jgi:hypothetical protein